MEIRHVYRRTMRKKRAGRFSPAIFLMLAVFIGVAYLVGASALGTWLASDIVAPAILKANPVETALPVLIEQKPETTAEAETEDIANLESLSCFAVQIGAYENAVNAQEQSERLKDLGAAGYIVEDDGLFRVLAAGYPDRVSAESVSRQLQTDGIETRIHEIQTDSVRIRVSGADAQLESFRTLTAFCTNLPAALYEAGIAFDESDMTSISAAELLIPIRQQYAALREDAYVQASGIAAYSAPMTAYLDEILTAAELLDADQDVAKAEISSRFKGLYLQAVMAYQELINYLPVD